MRVPDERDVREILEDREAFAGLLGREDILEFFEPKRGAVAKVEPRFVHFALIGQRLEPAHIRLAQDPGVVVECLARRLVVVRIVHAPGDGGVVVAEDRRFRHLTHDIRAFVGTRAVPNDITEAVEPVDRLGRVRLHHGGEGLDVGVDVAKNSDAHTSFGGEGRVPEATPYAFSPRGSIGIDPDASVLCSGTVYPHRDGARARLVGRAFARACCARGSHSHPAPPPRPRPGGGPGARGRGKLSLSARATCADAPPVADATPPTRGAGLAAGPGRPPPRGPPVSALMPRVSSV